MDCPTCEAMVDAYVDGELSTTENAAFEQALAVCPGCRARLESARDMSRLLRSLPAEPAPDLLRARIERELRPLSGSIAGRPKERVRWLAMAASLIVALGVGWIGGSMLGQGTRETDELLAGYLRVAMSDSGVEVASSDRHTVKPWFAGKLPFAPKVIDLSTQGFPLVGARIDVIGLEPVASLVYSKGKHQISVMEMPNPRGLSTQLTQHAEQGYQALSWSDGKITYWVVSDAAVEELKTFVGLFQELAES